MNFQVKFSILEQLFSRVTEIGVVCEVWESSVPWSPAPATTEVKMLEGLPGHVAETKQNLICSEMTFVRPPRRAFRRFVWATFNSAAGFAGNEKTDIY